VAKAYNNANKQQIFHERSLNGANFFDKIPRKQVIDLFHGVVGD